MPGPPTNDSLQVFLDAVAGPAVLVDRSGTALACNRALCEACARSAEGIIGRNPLDFFAQPVREARQRHFEIVLETRRTHQWEDQRDGRFFLNTMNPVVDEGGAVEAVAVYSVDITRNKALEKHERERAIELERSRQMEAVARLASGLAHDLNNVLTVISASASLAREVLHDPPVVQQCLDDVLEANEKAAGMSKKLLALSSTQVALQEPVHLATAVQAVAPILRRLLDEVIELRIAPIPDSLWINIDPVHLDQVLVNLATNAGQAMESQRGALMIRFETVELPPDMTALAPGSYVLLEVQDEGPGIEPGVLPKVFEPFFTTRQHAGGSGLGLATVYGLARRYGGSVTVESTPGAGATFRVLLPRLEGPPAVEAFSVSTGQGADTDKVILLVDDEPEIRRVTQRFLERVGFRVECAKSAEDALAIAPTMPHIDLLLTDMVMGGRDGLDLARELQARRPGIACLFMSGYMPAVLDQKREVRRRNFISKPFTEEQLLAKVHSVLSNPAPPATSAHTSVNEER